MTNKYSFQDTGVTHILYQEQMQQFDLSIAALQEFAIAVQNGALDKIQSMFAILTEQQRKGLLTIELDYSALIDPFAWGIPRQTAIKHAQDFEHKGIAQFLTQTRIDSIISQMSSVSTLFNNNRIPFHPDVAFSFAEQDESTFNIK